MNRFIRRMLIGAIAGAVSSAALAIFVGGAIWSVPLGIALGAIYSLSLKPTPFSYLDNLMAAGSFGMPLWGLISVIAIPFFSGQTREWSAEQMREHFPSLAGWVLYCCLAGLLIQALNDFARSAWGPESEAEFAAPIERMRIVILGGGFAGMRVAESLQKRFRTDRSVSVTLVNNTNALLFTPMLAEVAGSSLEASHISTPLRSLHGVEFIRAHVTGIDLAARGVHLDSRVEGQDEKTSSREVPYDHLILALGGVSSYLGLANVEKLALDFKSLLDAIRIRNRVIEMFERADREPEASARRPLLTFVIAGGGFAGVELAGALNDFANGILADYPNVTREDLCVLLVHARDRILPELSESLAQYAQKTMEARGVRFRLNTRLADVELGCVKLSDGEVPAETLVWTAGTAPNPLLKSLPLEKDKRGAVVVDSALLVPGFPNVWALGDCAAVHDAETGKPCPPTAQFALREAEVVAKNIYFQMRGRPTEGFHFDSLGALCVVGHQTAYAELTVPFFRNRSIRFSGLLAWLMWRGIYWSKLPGLERKVRVLIDWTIELFFPRDIVQTIDLR
ncbi:MAG: NAD(P)/FAD-dependent oxidoreductase [Candidatus Acidiferrales bacterium]